MVMKMHIELIVNNTNKIERTLSQMEQWSIISNVIIYVLYSKNPKNCQAMLIKPINMNKINIERRKGGKEIYIMGKSPGHFR